MNTFNQALVNALKNKNCSYEYNCSGHGVEKKDIGYVYFSTKLNKVMFVSYGIPCSLTEKQALGLIKKGE